MDPDPDPGGPKTHRKASIYQRNVPVQIIYLGAVGASDLASHPIVICSGCYKIGGLDTRKFRKIFHIKNFAKFSLTFLALRFAQSWFLAKFF
jgi:hypothetical protein